MFELVDRRPNQLMVFLLSSFRVPIVVGLLSDIVFVPSAALFGVPAAPGLFGAGELRSLRPAGIADVVITVITLIFFQGTIGADEGLQFVFGTIPAFSTTGYSLGILYSRSVQRKLQDSNQGSNAGSAPET